MPTIRAATNDDVPAITAIYNAVIPDTTVVWSEQLQTVDQRQQWFDRQQRDGFPVLVAANQQDAEQPNEVIAFAAYRHFRGAGCWPGYRYTVEHTIHVRQDAWGRGVGRALMQSLLDRARDDGVHVMVGALDGDNTGSLQFHQRLGFEIVGKMPEVGRKFDRWLDLILVQRILG